MAFMHPVWQLSSETFRPGRNYDITRISVFLCFFQAYIFDIRSGTYLQKLTGHTDTVGDVEYHPLYPEVKLNIVIHVASHAGSLEFI